MPAPRRLAHRAIEAAAAAFNRNPWTNEALELMPRRSGPVYEQDGLRTGHTHRFIEDPAFARAYRRAVQAAGWDYEIHWRVHVILWAASMAQVLPGAFVECGTGRGFMASAICEHLAWRDRRFYLFDTFRPEAVGTSPDAGGQVRSPFYADGPGAVRENFRQWPGVQLVVGAIPDTLAGVDTGAVAFLHIDMNDPRPEEAAIRHFWSRVDPGGLIVFDDYAYAGFEASHHSANRVAADLGFSILSLPTGQGLAIKPPL